ncbi:MAG: nuclear transport factor 2 family protein [Crocosphaera sp.]|nr:nuclear transport factor 2 family protein [Crocosphaera sp.]
MTTDDKSQVIAINNAFYRSFEKRDNKGRRLEAQSMATNSFRKMAQKWYLVHHHGSPIMRQ